MIAAHREQVALKPDIFIPERGMLLDKLLHQLDAFLTLDNLDRDSTRAQKFLLPPECPVLPDDHSWNSIQDNGT